MWLALALACVSLAGGQQQATQGTERIPVAFVFHYLPDHSGALPYWHDPGFRGAMTGLVRNHAMDVAWFNLAEEGAEQRLKASVSSGSFAYVFAKGCWHTPADKFMRGVLIPSKPHSVRTGLFPACSSPPPPDVVTNVPIDRAYDTIFFDKMWMSATFEGHPSAVHAFGVDSPATFNTSGSAHHSARTPPRSLVPASPLKDASKHQPAMPCRVPFNLALSLAV